MSEVKLNDKQVSFVTWAGIVIVASGLTYAIYKIFFQKSTVDSTLDDLKGQGKYPTINDSQALSYADQLDNELDSVFVSESDVYGVFSSLQNLSDVLLVISKYGKRLHFSYNYFGDYSLPEYINLRLSSSEIGQINSILSSKNINYRF